ncbi:MAG: DUF4832 domain-containing protein [Verrucomicrobiota bacterium]
MSETAQEVELALDHRCRLAVVHGICLMALLCALNTHAATLQYAPQTNAVPLKGLERRPPGKSTIAWDYLLLRDVVSGPDEFVWDKLEAKLNRASSFGKQMILRPTMDVWSQYPVLPGYLTNLSGASIFIDGKTQPQSYPKGGIVPVYTNAATRAAMTNFINAFAEKYDGDPRIGFIEVGLLGTWGEWYNINIRSWPNSSVPLHLKREVLTAYQTHFKKTKLLMRWPDKDLGEFPFGYHDDWFAFWKTRDSLYQKQTNAGPETLFRWQTVPIGARLHPEFSSPDKVQQLPAQYATPAHLLGLIQRDHISWLRFSWDERYVPSNLRMDLEDLSSKMGYELHVPQADWRRETRPQQLHLSVTITNTAVAPFYYPWQVEVGLWHDEKLQQIWPVDWDITRILPGEDAITYTAILNGFPRRLKNARLLLHVVNPMKSGFPLRFANQTQDVDLDGWLTLGSIENN